MERGEHEMTSLERVKEVWKKELHHCGLTEDTEVFGGHLFYDIIDLLTVFYKQGHSGGSAPIALKMFNRLALYKPLSLLTGEESEWGTECNEDQNNRCPAVFRRKDGTAFYLDAKVFWYWETQKETGVKYKVYYKDEDSREDIEFPFNVPDEPKYIEKVPAKKDKTK